MRTKVLCFLSSILSILSLLFILPAYLFIVMASGLSGTNTPAHGVSSRWLTAALLRRADHSARTSSVKAALGTATVEVLREFSQLGGARDAGRARPGSHYEYMPLASDRTIRLMQILNETSSGIPQCQLTTVSLDDRLPFVALSYTWGSPLVCEEEEEGDKEYGQGVEGRVGISERCCQILCNRKLLNVTQNLYDFLKRAQAGGLESHLNPEDRIWVDAICIDQSSLSEHSAQVRLMAEIYKSARIVVVWLGESEPGDTRYAVELLEHISATQPEDLQGLKQLSIHDSRMSDVLGECGGSVDHWISLKRMVSRTWFSRIWVIQEIAFAKSILMLCGSYAIHWEPCVKAAGS